VDAEWIVAMSTLRRFKRYQAYKDSGIEWLGPMPASWEAKRLKDCVQRLESGGTPESDNPDYWTDDETGVPWVAISDMTRSFHVRQSARRLTMRGLESRRLTVVPSGTLLYSMYASLGRVALLQVDAAFNQAILAITTREESVSRNYLRWWLEFMQGHIQLLSSSSTQDNLNADKVRKMPVFVPGSSEQEVISSFLDQRTAHIDALIGKKEQLIRLLQEKRISLITRAVTKGLNPNVPMKSSGVEWLGEIPAHWKVLRIAMAASKIRNGYVGPTRDILVSDGVRYLQSLHIKGGLIDFERRPYFVTQRWSNEHEKSVLREGDVLVVQTGDIGQVAVVPNEFAGSNCHALIIIRLKRDVGVGEWLASSFQSEYGQAALAYSQTGALHPHLECGHVREIRFAFPGQAEQQAILGHLRTALERVDAMVVKVYKAIDRLQELRISLISAAVTGQIDLREEVA
jgi:type I restriction enzyme, S subunit